MKAKLLKQGLAGLALVLGSSTVFSETEIHEVVVTADFRDNKLLELSNSVTVINADTIDARGARHLEQLLNVAPNVNFSSGASRGRFFQIRGIGERSQFVDPVNPSVGLIVDGIDFTGLGLSASTLDIEQVEILRGPQGTLYGANALAGLINLKSNDPSSVFTGKVGAEIAEFDSRVLSGVISGPLSESVGYRISALRQVSDGFTDNDFLGRDDTSNIDEQFVRGKLRFEVSDDLLVDLVGFYVNADNGYDDFSLTNNRTTNSDQPGHDRQESFSAGATLYWTGFETVDLEATLSGTDADTEYGFDEDWSFVDEFDASLFPYSSADNFERQRENITADARLISKPGHEIFNDSTGWTLGVYARTERERLERTRFADLAFDSRFNNRFETKNYAVYGQLDSALGSRWTLISGLRVERHDGDYDDSEAVSRDIGDNLWGGRLALEYQLADEVLLYGLISRGYKAGGVNGQIISAAVTNPNITPDVFTFDTEELWNYELGLKGSWFDSRLQAQLALFYQDRSDAQVNQSIFNPADFSFDDFLANAEADSVGLEAEFNFQATEFVNVFGSIGLLDAEFDDFTSRSHVDARDDANEILLPPVNLNGRDIAHAPNYQFLLGTQIELRDGFYVRLEVEGKDEFFFSNSHDEKSDSYELFNMRLGYRAYNWELALWGRNLTDEDVAVRGFFFSNQFGNNPGNGYSPEVYEQLGEPRIIGVSASYSFE